MALEEVSDEIRREIEEQVRTELAQQAPDDDRDYLVQRLAFTEIERDFERIYNRIFGSQITLLESIATAARGWDRGTVDVYVREVQSANRALTGWTVDAYLQFLLVNGLLVVESDGSDHASLKGRAFLAYGSEMGYQAGMRGL